MKSLVKLCNHCLGLGLGLAKTKPNPNPITLTLNSDYTTLLISLLYCNTYKARYCFTNSVHPSVRLSLQYRYFHTVLTLYV